jgi:hypothetical protein
MAVADSARSWSLMTAAMAALAAVAGAIGLLPAL